MMLFLLLFGALSFSQTASLPNVTASPGNSLSVPLTVSGFTSIGSITFNIQIDPAVLTFTGITSAPAGFMAGVTGSTLTIVGAWNPSVDFPDGTLMNLNFVYNGVTTSPLNFLGSSVVTKGTLEIIHPVYTNGSVSMAVVSQTATLSPVTAATGDPVTVTVDYHNMPAGIGAITQKIHYDPTKLSFINVIGTLNLGTGVVSSADISAGIITITWSNSGGTNINFPSQFLLNFIYNGSTVTNIDFLPGCIITQVPPPANTNVDVTYYGGTITPSPLPAATAVLGSVTGASQGTVYEVPVTLSGFPSGASGGVQAFTLTIPFDSPRLSYIGIKSPAPSGLVVNQASGVLTLAWSNLSGPDINGNFFTLKFRYNGVGVANVSFGNGCVFNTNTGGIIGTVQTGYTNATITPATTMANATIDHPEATTGSEVLVPVNFSDLPSDMGAATLAITYDFNQLTFIDTQNTLPGTTVKLNGSTHVINIAWNGSGSTDINGVFLKLRFLYVAGGSGCGANVSFTDGCELAQWLTGNIVQTNWNNGGVNVKFKISGYLTYANVGNTAMDNCTVALKTNPAGVTVSSVTTDATGYFEFWAVNGSYKLTASTTKAWGGVTTQDINSMKLHIINAITLTGIFFTAGDVNLSGTISVQDISLVKTKIVDPTFPLPAGNWVFDNPVFSVMCADSPNNVRSLCTGDVNGSYVPPSGP